MPTLARSHSANTQALAGSGASSGCSRARNCERREPVSFWKGFSLSPVSTAAMAAFSSARVKKVCLRRRAKMYVSTYFTPLSTLALS